MNTLRVENIFQNKLHQILYLFTRVKNNHNRCNLLNCFEQFVVLIILRYSKQDHSTPNNTILFIIYTDLSSIFNREIEIILRSIESIDATRIPIIPISTISIQFKRNFRVGGEDSAVKVDRSREKERQHA